MAGKRGVSDCAAEWLWWRRPATEGTRNMGTTMPPAHGAQSCESCQQQSHVCTQSCCVLYVCCSAVSSARHARVPSLSHGRQRLDSRTTAWWFHESSCKPPTDQQHQAWDGCREEQRDNVPHVGFQPNLHVPPIAGQCTQRLQCGMPTSAELRSRMRRGSGASAQWAAGT